MRSQERRRLTDWRVRTYHKWMWTVRGVEKDLGLVRIWDVEMRFRMLWTTRILDIYIEQTVKKSITLSYENVSRMQDSSCIALIKWRHGSGFVSASV